MEFRIPQENLSARNINDLTSTDLAALSALKVAAGQEELGGTFCSTLAEWEDNASDGLLGFAFLLDGDPIGIVLLKRSPLSPPWMPHDAVSLHGLKINIGHQGRGFGRRVFQLAKEEAETAWATAERLVLAVDAENAPALALYRSFGMVDSGAIFEGRIGWEHQLELPLRSAVCSVMDPERTGCEQ